MNLFTANPAPAPDSGTRVQVMFRGEVIADSRDALRFDDTTYQAIYYFPRQDVKMECLERSSHESFCPIKGCATHYSLKDGPEDAVWSYENPYDRMRVIEGRIAFYPDKVDAIIAG
jgi:uncharacterized protein (DUF427 family)